jgi:hypothetical protein
LLTFPDLLGPLLKDVHLVFSLCQLFLQHHLRFLGTWIHQWSRLRKYLTVRSHDSKIDQTYRPQQPIGRQWHLSPSTGQPLAPSSRRPCPSPPGGP